MIQWRIDGYTVVSGREYEKINDGSSSFAMRTGGRGMIGVLRTKLEGARRMFAIAKEERINVLKS